MPPPFGTGSPSSTTRGLYSLLENGPEQWASTRQQTAAAATRPTPKPRLESCRPIRPPAPRHPCCNPCQNCPAMPQCVRGPIAPIAATIGSLPPHIAVRSRQEWGWFVPRSRKTTPSCAPTGDSPPVTKSASTAVCQRRAHGVDGDRSHQAGEEDTAKADRHRQCARERLPRHNIAIADGEAGDEGKIDGVAD